MTDLVRIDAIESALIGGDLAKLTPEHRVMYYRQMCQSIGLNPLTKPFEYITLNGKLTLYARKDAADQLRKLHNISISKPDIRFEDDWIIVTVEGSTGDGRTDSDIGVVSKKDMRGDFGNAVMKAVTKAKRRLTLSICGLGMLDETEIETIPDARVTVTVDQDLQALPAPDMTLEEAKAITSKDGTPYKDIPTDELEFTIKGIRDAQKAGKYPEKAQEYARKLKAAEMIIASRQS